jgi:hypothetical protein
MVGGPDAGRIRVIPESAGEFVKGEHDWVYQIRTLSFGPGEEPIHFAFAADQHPGQMFVQLWREYAPAIQIKGDELYHSYQKIREAQPSST